jgi:hypothetical protein
MLEICTGKEETEVDRKWLAKASIVSWGSTAQTSPLVI